LLIIYPDGREVSVKAEFPEEVVEVLARLLRESGSESMMRSVELVDFDYDEETGEVVATYLVGGEIVVEYRGEGIVDEDEALEVAEKAEAICDLLDELEVSKRGR